MSYPKGGLADKMGNRYEDRWMVKQLLRLIREHIRGIQIEQIDVEETGIDLTLRNSSGHCVAMQCKGSSGGNVSWSVNKLASEGVLEYAFKHIGDHPEDKYQLVSTSPARDLHSLVTHLTHIELSDPVKTIRVILSQGKQITSDFIKCCTAYNAMYGKAVVTVDTVRTDVDYMRVIRLLRQMDAVQYPDNQLQKEDLLDDIKLLYYGDAELIYSLLRSFASENLRWGQWINAFEIHAYLDKHGYKRKDTFDKEQAVNAIVGLNDAFHHQFLPIHGEMLQFYNTHDAISAIEHGESVILTGNAGTGKTGVMIALSDYFKRQGICHILIDLYRHRPERMRSSAYGDQLGLPGAPEECLDSISPEVGCVLMLDQLDSVRWTSNGYQKAWDVCAEMLKKVVLKNSERKIPISVVATCRTFDIENDPQIQQLFNVTAIEKPSNVPSLKWVEVRIDHAPLEIMQQVIGTDAFSQLLPAQQTILQIPRNLYLWTKLKTKPSHFLSMYDLQEAWMTQIRKSRPESVPDDSIDDVCSKLAMRLQETGRRTVARRLLQTNDEAIDYLASEGLLQTDKQAEVGFSHQSSYDYFIAHRLVQGFLSNEPLEQVIPPKENQTPLLRYQMQTAMEAIREDTKRFLAIAEYLVHTDNHFFIQQLAFETIGDSIEPALLNFVLQQKELTQYMECVRRVFRGSIERIEYLIRNGILKQWMIEGDPWREIVRGLLFSVAHLQSSVVDGFLDSEFAITTYSPNQVLPMLGNVEDDTGVRFAFRKKLFYQHPVRAYVQWDRLAKVNPQYAIELVGCMQRREEMEGREERFDAKDIENLCVAARNLPELAMDELWRNNPAVKQATKNGLALEYWIQYGQQIGIHNCGSLKAVIVRMVLCAIESIALRLTPVQLREFCEPYHGSKSYVERCYILHMLTCCSDSEYAISYMLENPRIWLVDPVAHYDHYESAADLIKKHSPNISNEQFAQLEQAIYYYHAENEMETARHRFEFNHEALKSSSRHEQLAFWPYWGIGQIVLLPVLDEKRISSRSIELISVLLRKNETINIRNFGCGIGFRCSGASSVQSPIENRREKISDSGWISIIMNPKIGSRRGGGRMTERDGYFIDSSIEDFAASFGRAIEQNPARFIALAYSIGLDLPVEYVRSLLQKLSDVVLTTEQMDKVQLLINIYLSIDDPESIRSICRIVERHSKYKWNSRITVMLREYSTSKYESEKYCSIVRKEGEQDSDTYESLVLRTINSVRGEAIGAVGALLAENLEEIEFYPNFIDELINSKSEIALCAIVRMVLSVYRANEVLAMEYVMRILNEDVRMLLGFAGRIDVLQLWEFHREQLTIALETATLCGDIAVAQCAAGVYAYIYIMTGELKDCVQACIRSSAKHREAVVRNSIFGLNRPEYCNRSRELILAVLHEPDAEELEMVFRDLFQNLHAITLEDHSWIRAFASCSLLPELADEFYQVLRLGRLLPLSSIIFDGVNEIVRSYSNKTQDNAWQVQKAISETSHLIAFLYKECLEELCDETAYKCLDAWDKMLILGFEDMRQITEELDGVM